MKSQARVVATYAISAKAAPHLERLLRDELPRHISCTVLEVSTHGEQAPLEDEVQRGRDEQSVGLAPERRDADEDGGVPRIAGAGEQVSGGGNVDDGPLGQSVSREEDGDVGSAAADDTADSGTREGTGEGNAIVSRGD